MQVKFRLSKDCTAYIQPDWSWLTFDNKARPKLDLTEEELRELTRAKELSQLELKAITGEL